MLSSFSDIGHILFYGHAKPVSNLQLLRRWLYFSIVAALPATRAAIQPWRDGLVSQLSVSSSGS